MHLILHLVFLILLLAMAVFFASAETALFSLAKIQRRRLESQHLFLARPVLYLLDRPRQTLITILIGNLFVHTLAAAVATMLTLHYLRPHFLGPMMLVFTIFLVFFAEILPKIISVRKNEKMALAVALPLQIFGFFVYPARLLVRWITDRILVFLIDEKKELSQQLSEEELKTLVKIGEEEGVLDSQERRMIHKLFELGQRPVKDIMTPRIDLAALNAADPRPKHEELIRRHHFTHLPAYQNTVDNIVGVVFVQDYMLNPGSELSSFLKEPFFIPEMKRIADLLLEFREKDSAFAVCVDEYGGTAGIVTLEDVLEEIFGEFYDEYAKVENPIRPVGQEFIVEAKIPLSDFNDYFNSHLESEDASTLGGWILERLGKVPEKGKVIEDKAFRFRIQDVIRNRRIRSVMVRRKA